MDNYDKLLISHIADQTVHLTVSQAAEIAKAIAAIQGFGNPADYVKFNYLEANYTKTNVLEANYLTATQINSLYASITYLNTAYLTAEAIEAKYATINELNVQVANINTVLAGYIKATDIVADNVSANQALINSIKFNTAVGLTLSAQGIVSFNVSSDYLTIKDAFIKSAMIDSLVASKITSGSINTSLVTLTSTSGRFVIADNTILISDTNRARVQIGKDASNDYNMYVWDATGNLMFDAAGLTASGITRKIIRNDIVADDANIAASKIDMVSVVTAINNGTTTISTSKLSYNGTSFDLMFGTWTDSSTNVCAAINANTAYITANKDMFAVMIQDYNSLGGTNGSKWTSFKQTYDAFTTTVSSTYATKADLTTTNNNVSTITQTANKISWLVSSGTSSTDFTITDRLATLVGDRININGYVTFSALSATTGTTIIDGSRIIAGTVTAAQLSANAITISKLSPDVAGLINGYVTINSKGTYGGYWVRLCRMYIGGQYGYCNTDIAITNGASGSGMFWAEIGFRVKQQNVMAGAPTISLYYKAGSWLAPGNFGYKIIQNDASATVVDLYMQLITTWETFKYTPNNINANSGITWFNEDAPVASVTGLNTATDVSFAPTRDTLESWKYSNSTYIDGGKIYTGSITAGQINVADLFAQNITATNLTISGNSTVAGWNTTGNSLISPVIAGVIRATIQPGVGATGSEDYNVFNIQSLVNGSWGSYAGISLFGTGTFEKIICLGAMGYGDGAISCLELNANRIKTSGLVVSGNNIGFASPDTSGVERRVAFIGSDNCTYFAYDIGYTYDIIMGHRSNTNEIHLKARYWVRCGEDTQGFIPNSNGLTQLGLPSFRWSVVYAATGAINTSDRSMKKDIATIDDKYMAMLDLITPSTFKMIDGTSGRTHAGWVADDVEAAMLKVGLSAIDFAGFCKDKIVERGVDTDGKECDVPKLDENGIQIEQRGLRYEEFIPLLHEKIRRLEAKLIEHGIV